MTDWNAIGARFGAALVRLVEPLAGDAIRAAVAEKNGICRSCMAPLSGPSPQHICTGCHAAEVLAQGLGGGPGGEA